MRVSYVFFRKFYNFGFQIEVTGSFQINFCIVCGLGMEILFFYSCSVPETFVQQLKIAFLSLLNSFGIFVEDQLTI